MQSKENGDKAVTEEQERLPRKDDASEELWRTSRSQS